MQFQEHDIDVGSKLPSAAAAVVTGQGGLSHLHIPPQLYFGKSLELHNLCRAAGRQFSQQSNGLGVNSFF